MYAPRRIAKPQLIKHSPAAAAVRVSAQAQQLLSSLIASATAHHRRRRRASGRVFTPAVAPAAKVL
jgi:hypothetical protein